jgi:chromosome segregation and condensation protein ScpB
VAALNNVELITALEVLACITFKQQISQVEIDQLFDADKRGRVVKMRNLKLVENSPVLTPSASCDNGSLLQRFGLASLGASFDVSESKGQFSYAALRSTNMKNQA